MKFIFHKKTHSNNHLPSVFFNYNNSRLRRMLYCVCIFTLDYANSLYYSLDVSPILCYGGKFAYIQYTNDRQIPEYRLSS